MPSVASSIWILVFLVVGSPGAGSFEQITTSDACGVCHRDIYRTWKSSAHARSLENPVFLATFHEAKQSGREDAVRVCLDCHAPMIAVTGDKRLRDKVTWEGVNCDFCHSLTSVKIARTGPQFELDVGRIKRGPIREATALVHDVEYSSLHETSLVCAPCHEYVNSAGVTLMSTFSEWKASSAAESGRNCQECHMSQVEGDVVDPRIMRVPGVAVNLHEMPGGHSLSQLFKALSVQIRGTRNGDELDVEVRLKNKGAGHAVPTGMPGRRVHLQVVADTGDDKSFREKRIFERGFLDAAGRRITRDVDFFAPGVRPGPDTRLQADEVRRELFTFPVSSAKATVHVKLYYEHAPLGTAEDRTRITFFSDRRSF